MKSWLFYSLAAAVAALPIGWIFAGVAEALSHDMLTAQAHRPLYAAGDHVTGALVAGVVAALVVFLVGLGRSSHAKSSG